MTIQTRSQVVELLNRHGLVPRKVFGQHFLADPNLIRKMVASSGVSDTSQVLEIGVGTATLTAALAATGARVVGYEVDERLAPIHDEVLAALPLVEVRYRDVMGVDLDAELGSGQWTMVANLPYNVGTPLVLDVLRHVPRIDRVVVMVQLEVAQRLAAAPGSRIYGLPSVVAQLNAEIGIAFKVPAQVFVPPPKVMSAVVIAVRKPSSPHSEAAIAIAASAFGQRRKMLRGVLGLTPDQFERAGVVPTDRAEDLAPEAFLRLAEVAGE